MKATSEMKVKKFMARYPKILNNKKIDLDILKKIHKELPEPRDFMLISYRKDYLHYIVMSLLMKYGKYEDVLIMNAYTLLDICLGNSEERKSILDIKNNIVVIYLGYSEFENKRQSDVIEQLIEQQRVHGRKCWIMFKGSRMESKYFRIPEMIEENLGIIYRIEEDSPSEEIYTEDLL